MKPSLIVGVGASAGGLAALTAMFKAAPKQTGMAFIVVQHLSPSHKSLMPQLLASQTELTVVEATDDAALEADTIYVLQPQTTLRLQGEKLRVRQIGEHRVQHTINGFFTSMAKQIGDRSVAVILSGSGSDGADGAVAVKDAGGIVIVQEPETAEFDGMLQAGLRTGRADMVLAPELIVDELMEVYEAGPAAYFGLAGEQGLPILRRILQRLKQVTAIDYGHYKSHTIVRRIERRMQSSAVEDPRHYASRLEADEDESRSLARDLLIGVTRFLRDPEAVEEVQRMALPMLVEHDSAEPLRVWVAGCSTGEEAYSLALLLNDALAAAGSRRPLRVFATDLDDRALEMASAGWFPKAIDTVLPAALIRKHFTERSDGYEVNRQLRDVVLFSRHNVIDDPPFSKLDFISCRNLLIYLKPPIQERVLRTFSASLKDNGILWLGSSETVGAHEREFKVLSTRWRLYAARPGRQRHALVPGRRPLLIDRRISRNRQSRLVEALEEATLPYAPPMLVIDDQLDVVYRFGDLGALVSVPSGMVSVNVRDLLPASLSPLVVSAAMRLTERPSSDIRYNDLQIDTVNGESLQFSLRLRRLAASGDAAPWIALLFENLERSVRREIIDVVDDNRVAEDRLRLTERELQDTRESLHTSIQDLETANEELQATNEELIAANEELQSTNEELQSVNEELHTVNVEHEVKVNELVRSNADLDNVLRAIDHALLVVDLDLRLRLFNEASSRYFNLLPQDVGRPLNHLRHRLTLSSLLDDIAQVAHTGLSREHATTTTDEQRAVLVRMRPHLAADGNATGVVLTVTDVEALNRAEVEGRELRRMLEGSSAAIGIVGLGGVFLRVNDAFGALIKRDHHYMDGRTVAQLCPDEDAEKLAAIATAVAEAHPWRGVLRVSRPDGGWTWLLMDIIPSASEATGAGHLVIARSLTVAFRSPAGLQGPTRGQSGYFACWPREDRAVVVTDDKHAPVPSLKQLPLEELFQRLTSQTDALRDELLKAVPGKVIDLALPSAERTVHLLGEVTAHDGRLCVVGELTWARPSPDGVGREGA